jgi:archaellin
MKIRGKVVAAALVLAAAVASAVLLWPTGKTRLGMMSR